MYMLYIVNPDSDHITIKHFWYLKNAQDAYKVWYKTFQKRDLLGKYIDPKYGSFFGKGGCIVPIYTRKMSILDLPIEIFDNILCHCYWNDNYNNEIIRVKNLLSNKRKEDKTWHKSVDNLLETLQFDVNEQHEEHFRIMKHELWRNYYGIKYKHLSTLSYEEKLEWKC